MEFGRIRSIPQIRCHIVFPRQYDNESRIYRTEFGSSPDSLSYPHRLDLQTWRMEISDEPQLEAQKPEILAKTTFEPGCDLADGDGSQEHLLVHNEKPGFSCLDKLSTKSDGDLFLDLVRNVMPAQLDLGGTPIVHMHKARA